MIKHKQVFLVGLLAKCTCEQSEQLGAWEAGFEYQKDVVPIGGTQEYVLGSFE